MILIDWYEITMQALSGLVDGFVNFIPKLLGALIVFLVGWIVAVAVGKIVAEILKKLQFNKIFEKEGWKKALNKAEIKVDPSSFIGAIFKWILLIVFLAAAVEILELTQFAILLNDILAYLPNVIVAALLFVAAVVIADILEKVLRTAVEGAEIGYGNFVGVIVKWSIWIFAILMILSQLKIVAASMILQGIVYLIVIAGGIAFGLGGKDVAAEILRDLKDKLKN